MKKVMIICAAGMSSSLIAKKATEHFTAIGVEIELEATHASLGVATIEEDKFDMYLCSPQTKIYYKTLKQVADKVGKPIKIIPPQAYIPIPLGIEKLAKLVTDTLDM